MVDLKRKGVKKNHGNVSNIDNKGIVNFTCGYENTKCKGYCL
jgi:hypothetical protein